MQNRWKSGIFLWFHFNSWLQILLFLTLFILHLYRLCKHLLVQALIIFLFYGCLFGIWLTSNFSSVYRILHSRSQDIFNFILIFLPRLFSRGMTWLSFTEFKSFISYQITVSFKFRIKNVSLTRLYGKSKRACLFKIKSVL